jgi:hypothetical protein
MSVAVPSLDTSAAMALERLAWARASGRPCAPVRTLLPDGDIGAAYAVQAAWVTSQVAAGDSVVGRKIGLTSPAVQAQLGVGQPGAGDHGGNRRDPVAVGMAARAVADARARQPVTVGHRLLRHEQGGGQQDIGGVAPPGSEYRHRVGGQQGEHALPTASAAAISAERRSSAASGNPSIASA